jgi:hypothetical protein
MFATTGALLATTAAIAERDTAHFTTEPPKALTKTMGQAIESIERAVC